MADGRINWNYHALGRAIASGSRGVIESVTSLAESNANALGSGFRTGRYYDRQAGQRKGDTAPVYASNVEVHGIVPVGMVYTGNYAAAKDNMENNTLLKAVPHV